MNSEAFEYRIPEFAGELKRYIGTSKSLIYGFSPTSVSDSFRQIDTAVKTMVHLIPIPSSVLSDKSAHCVILWKVFIFNYKSVHNKVYSILFIPLPKSVRCDPRVIFDGSYNIGITLDDIHNCNAMRPVPKLRRPSDNILLVR